MEQIILKKIYESLAKGKKVALASVTKSIGSTPGKKGAIMAVWEDGSICGTVGGGKVEYEVKNRALQCMEKEQDEEYVFKLNNKGDLDMQCGGETTVFIKVFKPKNKLLIIGGGHIGIEIFKLCKMLNFDATVFEDREEFGTQEIFKDADEVIVGKYSEELSKYSIDSNTYIVIVTRGHKCDEEALREVIKTNASYIGMIGSTKKIKHIMNNLIEEGIDKETLKKVYAPIGLNISSDKPNEIAFGIMSEILLIKNKGTLQHMKQVKNITI